MIGLNLYEEEVKSILSEAMGCGMSGGVVSSVPILHATPAAFIAHSNDRDDHEELSRSFLQVNPTLAMGTCSDKLHPSESDLESMRNGPLSSHWTLFEVKGSNTTADVSRYLIESFCERDFGQMYTCSCDNLLPRLTSHFNK